MNLVPKFASDIAVSYRRAKRRKQKRKAMASLYANAGGLTETIKAMTMNSPARVDIDGQVYNAAIESALDPQRPRWEDYINLSRQSRSDSHLVSQIRNRLIKFRREKFAIVNYKTQAEDKEKTKLLKTSWFLALMHYFIETDLYRYTLLEFLIGENEEGIEELQVKLVPRQNIIPQKKEVLINLHDSEGIPIRELNRVVDLIGMERGYDDDLGLFEALIPDVVSKKGRRYDLNVYSETKGQPILHIATKQEKYRQQYIKNGSEAGKSRVLVTGKDDVVKNVVGQTGTEQNFYINDMEYLDKAMSKAVTGNTLSAEGTSRSQGEVHERLSNSYADDDMQLFYIWVNSKLFPFLNHRFGYNFSETDEFVFTRPLEEEKEKKEGKIKKSEEAIQDETKKRNLPEQDTATGARAGFELSTRSTSDLLAIVTRIIENVFKGKLSFGKLDKKLFEFIKKRLVKAIEQGYEQAVTGVDFDTPDGAMLQKLADNQAVFAAHKNLSFIQDLNRALIDHDGKLRSFAEFKREALKIHEQYNIHWLRAEYQQSVSAAQAARKWVEIEEQKDLFPNLRYVTINDSNVRPSHQTLHNIVRPINDPFWDSFYPPNGWGCRCWILQEDEEVELTPIKQTENLTLTDDEQRFYNNVGKTGKVFASHPYFSNASTKDKENIDKLLGE